MVDHMHSHDDGTASSNKADTHDVDVVAASSTGERGEVLETQWTQETKRGLKGRHLSMLAVGGTIGLVWSSIVLSELHPHVLQNGFIPYIRGHNQYGWTSWSCHCIHRIWNLCLSRRYHCKQPDACGCARCVTDGEFFLDWRNCNSLPNLWILFHLC